MALTERYPLQACVWRNDIDGLRKLSSDDTIDVNLLDHRGNTGLHLAMVLEERTECIELLLNAGANPLIENGRHWTVLDEAIASKNGRNVELLLPFVGRKREMMGAKELFKQLKESPDFYVEMSWEFGSWVPFVSRMCPNDVYKIYKYGSNVRMDMTLLGYENNEWKRGRISLIFRHDGDSLQFIELNHDLQKAYVQKMDDNFSQIVTKEKIDHKMKAPLVTNYVDLDKITFERSRSFFGVGGEKNEDINGFPCRAYNAHDVGLYTRIRYEHLSESELSNLKSGGGPTDFPLAKFFMSNKIPDTEDSTPVTMDQYFDPAFEMKGHHVGMKQRETVQAQNFNASLWLCDQPQFPLSVKDQILPVIELFAEQNPYFLKLRDFITLQLPSGFPMKIEVPIFHVLKARVTFSNPYASQVPVNGVNYIKDGDVSYCVIDECCIAIPSFYQLIGSASRRAHDHVVSEQDLFFQMAIQNSIADNPNEPDDTIQWSLETEDWQLQKALMMSMSTSDTAEVGGNNNEPLDFDDDYDALQQALALSRDEARLAADQEKLEEEQLAEALRLSALGESK